jgi:hypothetical protein
VEEMKKLLTKINGKFAFGDDAMLSEESMQKRAIKRISSETFCGMKPQLFQEELRSKHILVTDNRLPFISCDRRGLMAMNSLKEIVDFEGIQ